MSLENFCNINNIIENHNVINKMKLYNDLYFDTDLIKKFYNMDLTNFMKYYHEKGIIDGCIINKTQLNKFYDCKYFDNYIEYNFNRYSYSRFKDKFINNVSFTELYNNIIISKDENIIDNNIKTIFLVHSSNNIKLNYILNKLKDKKNFLLLLTTTLKIEKKTLNEYNIINYSVYFIKNLGTDITPSIIIYNDYKNIIDHEVIIKIHTKGDNLTFKMLTDGLLNYDELKLNKFIHSNKKLYTIPKYIYNIGKDTCVRRTVNIYLNPKIINNLYFCAITFFWIKKEVFNTHLDKCSLLIKSSLINNFYYDNQLFISNSPVHTLERLLSCGLYDDFFTDYDLKTPIQKIKFYN
jgi:hypothetical protein